VLDPGAGVIQNVCVIHATVRAVELIVVDWTRLAWIVSRTATSIFRIDSRRIKICYVITLHTHGSSSHASPSSFGNPRTEQAL
jgi:hypothetical protein